MSEQAPSQHSDNEDPSGVLENSAGENTAGENTKGTWVPGPTTPRVKAPSPSPLRRILPPIFGALTALPIALGILWYGFGKDIGNAGPTVARYLPWIVPKHLRGSARWRYNPDTDAKQKQFDSPSNLDAGEFGRIGGGNK